MCVDMIRFAYGCFELLRIACMCFVLLRIGLSVLLAVSSCDVFVVVVEFVVFVLCVMLCFRFSSCDCWGTLVLR